MDVREQREGLTRRARYMQVVLQVVLAVIAGGYWLTQVVRGEHYRELAENNRLRSVPIKAPRGLIYDRHGRILVENVPSYELLLDRSRTRQVPRSVLYAATVLDRPVAELEATLERFRTTPSFQPVPLVQSLQLPEISRFDVASLEYPEFEIGVRHLRYYRQGRQTAHVMGYLGEVSPEELSSAPDEYSLGDLVGRRGVEATYDKLLRGHDGERIVVVDSRGKPLEEYGRQPAEAGRSLMLTLDLDLQELAESLMSEKIGAVVALDPRNGEILAMVASPSYDPNLFSRRLGPDEWRELVDAEHHPLQNRPLQSAYSPGSVFKIVMATAGLSEGVVGPNDSVHCGGAAYFYGRRFRCWRRGGHGRVNLHQAIKVSCDIYFYQLGQKLGIERIADYARRFGLGSLTGIDIGGERAGLVPGSEWSQRVRKHPWYPGETISVAIGQGPLLTTPLQIAVMTAVVANGGHTVVPHLWREIDGRGEVVDLDPQVLAVVAKGLWGVVNEPGGTASYAARLPGLGVAGKTGTAQVIAQQSWTDSDTLPFEHRDHAWFASYAPFDDPRLVVVVFAEHGGHGSSAAAPVAKALYEQYFDVKQPDPAPGIAG